LLELSYGANRIENNSPNRQHMTDTHDSDDALLHRSVAGDEGAFTALYRRRHPAIYRFALHMSGSATVAEEVTQEVFLMLIREMGRFDARRGPVAAWLLGVARNHVLRLLERNRQYVAIKDEGAEIPDEAVSPLGDLARTETVETVRQAVLTLPPAYREAIALCDLEEMTYSEAAEVMGVPIGTVRSRVNRGRTLLLEKLRGANKLSSIRCFV
jgi:RNA polymerase sigma-70 factor (ECF subfamily)